MLSVMVSDLSKTQRITLLVEGLNEPLHGLVRSYSPTSLQDTISRTQDLQDATQRPKSHFPAQGERLQTYPIPKSKAPMKHTFPPKGKDTRPAQRNVQGRISLMRRPRETSGGGNYASHASSHGHRDTDAQLRGRHTILRCTRMMRLWRMIRSNHNRSSGRWRVSSPMRVRRVASSPHSHEFHFLNILLRIRGAIQG